jgi:DNA-binding HxlR family transcriptional regulator
LWSGGVIPASPVGVEYEITPLGRTLQPPFRALYAWTIEQMPAVEAAREAFDKRAR